MTRHRVPTAPARRQSRHHSPRRAAAAAPVGIADAIIADALGGRGSDPEPTRLADDGHRSDPEPNDLPEWNDAAGNDADDESAAHVEQDRPEPPQAAGRRAAPVPRGRRQLVVTVLSAVCVASLTGVLVTASPASPVGFSDSGFGVLLAQPPPEDGTELPHSLISPPVADKPAPGGGQQDGGIGGNKQAANGLTNGTGPLTPLAQGVAALFGKTGSPWVQQIPSGAAVDPNSSGIVAGMEHDQFHISEKEWTVPVYYADAGTPRSNVPLTAGYMSVDTLKDVPVPSNAQPDPSEDAHLAIVDQSTNCVYDFWGASRSGDGLTAKMGNAMPTDTDGAYPGGLGSRGSGFSAAAGIITPADLKKGSIDHALVFAYPNTRSGGPVYPATKSDGQTGGSDALPEGGRVRLDPSLDLGSLGLNSYELMIAKAMQKYGMILGDTSGGFTIYAQNPQSIPSGSYGGLLPDDTYVDLSKIPTQKLQVLKLPAQKSGDSETIGNRCNGF